MRMLDELSQIRKEMKLMRIPDSRRVKVRLGWIPKWKIECDDDGFYHLAIAVSWLYALHNDHIGLVDLRHDLVRLKLGVC